MAWTTPKTWIAGEVITGADLNTELRDNMLETMTAKATTAGYLCTRSANQRGSLTKFYEKRQEGPVVNFTADPDLSLDWVVEEPILEVPVAEGYLIWCGARMEKTTGTGNIFIAPTIVGQSISIDNISATNETDGFSRSTGGLLYDVSIYASTAEPSENGTYTFGMAFGGINGGGGVFAQRILTILPLGEA